MKEEFNLFKITAGRIFFSLYTAVLAFDVHMELSKPVLGLASYVIGGKGLIRKKVDVIALNPQAWRYAKYWYAAVSFAAFLIAADYLYRNVFGKLAAGRKPAVEDDDIETPPYPYDCDKLQVIVGLKHSRTTLDKVKHPEWLIVDEKGMYQSFLVTGATGTGKTACAMYPFTKQAMFYKPYDEDMKPGMLVLDVKGNFYEKVLEFAKEAGREKDVAIIEVGGKYKYNPLHKPHILPLVLAGTIKTVLSLFSAKSASDGYWNNKASFMITQCIILSRLYNGGYVTFSEIYRLVNSKPDTGSYLDFKLAQVEEMVESGLLTEEEKERFDICCEYFYGEFANLSDNTLSIIKSVVTEMTEFFYIEPLISKTFCPPKEELNFHGFKDVIDKGSIVILKMNIKEFENVAKTIAAYMKLDFQAEVSQRLVREDANKIRPVFMICDEYHAFATATDADFFDKCRESKCCNILATQSYTSLVNTLKSKEAVSAITQNIVNKIWLRTGDTYTAKEIQEETGKEDREKVSRSISESSGDVKKSRIMGRLVAERASLSESISISLYKESVFDDKLIRQNLANFTGIAFLSCGGKIIEPTVVHLQPYFGDIVKNCVKLKGKTQGRNPGGGLNKGGRTRRPACPEGGGTGGGIDIAGSKKNASSIEKGSKIFKLKERGKCDEECKKQKEDYV